LSLFFGGLLWPLAWLWAYTKPVLHKMAYGTDVDESFIKAHSKEKDIIDLEAERKAAAAAAAEAEVEKVRTELTLLAQRLQAAKERKA
jgi:hypothetical protein